LFYWLPRLVLVDSGFEGSAREGELLDIDLPPMLSIPHQLVGAPLGYSVKLECYTEAHPTSLNYWTREDKHMIHDNSKYKVVSTPEVPSYKTHMTLEIYDI
ncbi:lachesin-like isoform X5, partial [Vespula squamosa]